MTKLHYFKGRGRAETTRWMLAVNEIAFENVAAGTPEDLVALRATGTLPFNQCRCWRSSHLSTKSQSNLEL